MNLNYFVFLSFVFLVSCSEPTCNIRIDNPTNDNLRIKMATDQETDYFIGRYSKKIAKFKAGEYPIIMDGDSIGKVILEPGKSYLINPTLATYYMDETVYADDNNFYNLNGAFKLPLNITTIDSINHSGHFEVFKDLLIERKWDLDFKEHAPKYIKSKGNSVVNKTKIYRETSFMKFVVKPQQRKLEKMMQ